MPQKRMECFRLILEHLAWMEHQFLSGIRDSRKAGTLWGILRGVGGVRKSIHQSWLAKGLGLGLLCWGFKGVQKEMGIKTVAQPPYSRVIAPYDFWLFPKLRGCRYETTEEMKEAVTKVIDMLTQQDFHGAFQKLLERYNNCSRRRLLWRGLGFHECTINKSAHTKNVWKLI